MLISAIVELLNKEVAINIKPSHVEIQRYDNDCIVHNDIVIIRLNESYPQHESVENYEYAIDVQHATLTRMDRPSLGDLDGDETRYVVNVVPT